MFFIEGTKGDGSVKESQVDFLCQWYVIRKNGLRIFAYNARPASGMDSHALDMVCRRLEDQPVASRTRAPEDQHDETSRSLSYANGRSAFQKYWTLRKYIKKIGIKRL
jgi:hypothetical protein